MGDKATYVIGGIVALLLILVLIFVFRLIDKIETKEYCDNLPLNEAFSDSRCDDYWKDLVGE